MEIKGTQLRYDLFGFQESRHHVIDTLNESQTIHW